MASESDEGAGNGRRFESVMGQVLRVSKEELAKREAAYKKQRRRKKARPVRPTNS